MEFHNIEPVYNKDSKILILGSFPSVKSRQIQFFYGHPQNRFWRVLSAITNSQLPQTVAEKKKLLLNNNIALWDVIKSCDINGSSDTSIKNAIPNDLNLILNTSSINQIYANGSKAYQLYMSLCYHNINKNIIKLPSTSPANAAYSLEKLIEAWKCIYQ